MKKVFLLLAILATGYSFAQCVPNTSLSDPGLYPPGATTPQDPVVMPDGYMFQSYSEVVQVVSLQDTLIDTMGFQINASVDSIIFVKLDNLPSGFSYSCHNARCSWMGGEKGCVTITGTTNGPAKKYFVEAKAYAYVDLGILGKAADTLVFNMELRIRPPMGDEENAITNNGLAFFPNPISNRGVLAFSGDDNTPFKLEVLNPTGQLVYRVDGISTANQTKVELDTQSWANGIYLARVQMGNNRRIIKIMVRH